MNQMSNQSAPNIPTEASASVLVVDDDEVTQELMAEMLSMMGFKERYIAKDGKSALKTLNALAEEQRPPKFLICDIFMPNMDAFEFLDQLAMRQYSGGIILMTGMDPQMLLIARKIAAAHGLQVLGTILKPVSIEKMTNLLRL